ncbi:MAG: spermidine/putrescine transport system ATP-binding protein [Rhodospirillaceae bacterium]|jgi:spermidine/putrescine ABC transporter ATP-binding subunit|nr:spermidine/putrescine transport system ATP-binding protein [Rhodospirillaceae bacterium]
MTKVESYISIRGVTKHFGNVRAVDDVSFDIRAGEFFSLLGPSGCGKTTLLRMLAGFETPTAGEIFIDGQPMSAVPANRRPTNMVFQNYAIFPHLDVRRNIAYGLRKQRLTKAEIDATVERALELIKLPGYGDRRADQLSGGQRQRVALARALVCQPKVLLLDEPLGALDKKLREEMQLELRQLQRSVGITFMLVTHDQEEALTMSDRIAVISKGKVLQLDTATRLYEAPGCREVAEFIGSMNFIEGNVGRVVDGHCLVQAGALGELRVRLDDKCPLPEGRVTLAVRPEKLQIGEEPPAQRGDNHLQGRLIAQAYRGDRNHYYVEVDGLSKPLAVAAQNMTRHAGGDSPAGRPVWVSWSADAGVLLPDDRPAADNSRADLHGHAIAGRG